MFGSELRQKSIAFRRKMNLNLPAIRWVRIAHDQADGFTTRHQRRCPVGRRLETFREFADGRPLPVREAPHV